MPKMSSAFYIDNQRKQAAPVDEEVVDGADVVSGSRGQFGCLLDLQLQWTWTLKRRGS